MRSPASHPFLDHPGTLAFAHRGGAEEYPENSLASFRHAVDLGYRYLETDVHATRDGVVLAFHDNTLDRVTDRSGQVADLPWSEVSGARIAGREPIPLLSELLEEFPEARINIDPKDDRVVEPLVDLIRDHGALHRVCLGAFSDRRLARCRSLLGPAVCTSAGPLAVARPVWAFRPADRPPCASKCQFASPAYPSWIAVCSGWPTVGAFRSTCGLSTIQARWSACWTSAWTGS